MICQTKKIGKCFKSPNTTNSDLLTVVFLNTQRINEFLTSYNTNTYAGYFCSFDITFMKRHESFSKWTK